MAAPKIFIDGHVGTTGLRIRESLASRADIKWIELDESQRKDRDRRYEKLNEADLAILCLPDDAAREAVSLIENEDTRIIDASTAHRVDPQWTYGLAELARGQRECIAKARRVSNPGCWPTSVILALRPLLEALVLDKEAPIILHGLSGYTGGGRSMIERWEDPDGDLVGLAHEAPYALEGNHKHAPELLEYTGLARQPYFLPAVGAFRCGMRVEMPLHTTFLKSGATAERVHEVLADRYADEPFVHVAALEWSRASDERTFDPQACNGTNRVDLHVVGHPDGHVLVVGLLDNLGKGAAGAAVQNLNLLLGFEEEAGLSR